MEDPPIPITIDMVKKAIPQMKAIVKIYKIINHMFAIIDE